MESKGVLLPHSQQSANCPYSEPEQSSSFPLLSFYLRISPVPRSLCLIRDIFNFLRWGVVSTSPNTQAGIPPPVGCPRLLIKYIRSYSAYLKAVPPSATWGSATPWWQGSTYHDYFILLTCRLAVCYSFAINPRIQFRIAFWDPILARYGIYCLWDWRVVGISH
jgi:hypothetical protein